MKSIRFELSLLGIALASSSVSFFAMAQDSGQLAGVPWGPVTVHPTVDVAHKSNDNIYSQSSLKMSSNITVVAPKVKIEAKTGPHAFDATARIERGLYNSVSSANYTDQGLSGNAAWVLSGRSDLKMMAEYFIGHDDQGSTPGVTQHDKPDLWHQSSVGGTTAYGAEGAQGRVEFDAGLTNKRYDNFLRTLTSEPDNLKRDRDDAKLGATLYWRVMPKTKMLFQVAQTQYNYRLDTVPKLWTSLNSTDRKLLVGVTWDAAAKTTGVFKIGSEKKDFADGTLADFSGTSWDGSVRWSPVTYSGFEVASGRSTNESSIGNASLDTRLGLSWNHSWNNRLTSLLSLSNTNTDYQGADQTDKVKAYGMKVNYQASRNIKLGVGYDRTDKTSSSKTAEYQRGIINIFLSAAL